MSDTPVWILHKTWSGDTSARILFLTREQGVIRALCKGGRTPKKQACLQPFTPLWVALDERRGWFYVRHLEIAAPTVHLTHAHLFSALYLNELLYHTLRPEDPHPEIYDAYTATLNILNVSPDMPALERSLRRFEWTLLSSIGYGISLRHDVNTQPIMASEYYVFHAGSGMLPAKQGILGAHLLALDQDCLDDPAVLRTAKHVMRQAVDHALGGKEIKTRRLVT
ncbi:MAG: DNA repair protein RecO [Gammaproteobacteria bacterium]|nr:DNA repair protein RecO [Gammaproteobacteria bacterium]